MTILLVLLQQTFVGNGVSCACFLQTPHMLLPLKCLSKWPSWSSQPPESLQDQCFRFYSHPFLPHYNLLPLTTKTKNLPEARVAAKAAQKPTPTRNCLSSVRKLDHSSELLWFLGRVYPGKPTKGGHQSATGCCYPLIDFAACNFQAGRPTSHHINILPWPFYNERGAFLLNKPSLVQASVRLLSDTCRTVFL